MKPRFIYSADSTFHIGQIHVNRISPCQDFTDTLVTVNRDKAFLVVSDGCSSGGQTDIGSRLVARKLVQQARHDFSSDNAPTILGWYDISKNDLDFLALQVVDVYATAMSCYADQKGLSVCVYGDGVVAFVENDGSMRLEQVEWQKNTPFYPIYGSRLGKKLGLYDSFINQHKNKPTPLLQTTVTIQNNQTCWRKETSHPIEQGLSGIRFEIGLEELSRIKLVALFSDGVGQVGISPSQGQLNWITAVNECLAFKNTNGDFVKRRVRRAIQDWKSQQLLPQDDLSCSALLINKETQTENQKGQD